MLAECGKGGHDLNIGRCLDKGSQSINNFRFFSFRKERHYSTDWTPFLYEPTLNILKSAAFVFHLMANLKVL